MSFCMSVRRVFYVVVKLYVYLETSHLQQNHKTKALNDTGNHNLNKIRKK
jgi:hypothetical protein